MTGFNRKPLGELCHIATGGTPSRAESSYFGGGIPWVKIGDLLQGVVRTTEETISAAGLDNSSAKVFPKGTVLISVFATIGRTAVLAVDAATNQAIAGVTPKSEQELAPTYLRYFFEASKRQLEGLARGVAQLNINLGILRALEVPVPSLEEQHRIAAILDKADALRTKRREALAQLDCLEKSIFVEMFGDPVTGPIGCEQKMLADCVSKLEYGPRFYNEAYSSDGVRIVRITDLDQSGALDFDSMPRMTVDEHTKKQFTLQPGDIVFARTGATVGKVALIRESDPPSIAGAYFIRLRFDESLVPLYAYSVLRAQSIQALIEKKSRQAAQQNFSGPGLRALPMPVPPMSQQMAFESRVEKIHVEREKFAASLTEMDSLFASLQHRAFRGEL